jgi:hypothetical protein
MSLSVSVPSPRILIPRVQLSPVVRQRIMDSPKRTRVSPKRVYKKHVSPAKRSQAYKTNQQKFRSNPNINPETGRKIKSTGQKYKSLVAYYGLP